MGRIKQKTKTTRPEGTVPPQQHGPQVTWADVCQATSIHAAPYLARPDLHWTERVFWVAAIVAAAFYSITSCYSQWQRFRNNPIVYEYEYLYTLRNFTFLGVTFCAEYETEELDDLINRIWDTSATPALNKTEYYAHFLYVLNRLHYDNLENLKPFENDTSLNNLNYVDILLQLQHHIIPPPNKIPPLYAPCITEMGLCLTTTQLSRFINPYGKLETLNVTPVRQCGFFTECQYKYIPVEKNDAKLTLFIHDVNEVMLPHDRHTITYNTGIKASYVLKVLLSSVTAEHEVENLPVAYRKCRYHSENDLKYYSPYHPSLCRLECRIDHALDLCNCKPYFYAAAPLAPVCNISGMLCLARKKWISKPCNCMPLCMETNFIITEEYEQRSDGVGEQFERTIILKQELPKMGIKRRVVFSVDQLIMSFGGAIGLFLGASFMTFYGLVHLCLYFLIVKCKWTWDQAHEDAQIASVPKKA